MRIDHLKVRNYKAFRESAEMKFSAGFNVIVGKNNSGKSSLLEALRLRISDHPHKGPKTRKNVVNRVSGIEAGVSFSGQEIENAALRYGRGFSLPVPNSDKGNVAKFIYDFFERAEIKFDLTRGDNNLMYQMRYPSHGLFAPQGALVSANLNLNATSDGLSHEISSGDNDNVASILNELILEKIYFFGAERISKGHCEFGGNSKLNSNADNLPKAIFNMYSNNRIFNLYKELIREVLPEIHDVVVVDMGSNQLCIKVWMIDQDSDRDDLAFDLSSCGTGVSQVLAILCVAVNYKDSVVIIDEPSSFLHPGAAASLLKILARIGNNQYFISTHSAEIIAAVPVGTIHRCRWENGEAIVDEYDYRSITQMNEIVDDLGLSFGDVFSSDSIIWVEGPTEKKCFELISAGMEGLPKGVSFLSLRAPSDADKKKKSGGHGNEIFDIYDILSTGRALIQPALSFSLDSDERSDAAKTDINKRSKHRAFFLKRRMIENYFIHVAALHALLVEEYKKYDMGDTPDAAAIEACLSKYAPAFSGDVAFVDKLDSQEWLLSCDGANLLSALFDDVNKTMLRYDKVRHGPMIVRWLLDHDPDFLAELSAYVKGLFIRQPGANIPLL